MRMRKKKNGAVRLAACEEFLCEAPADHEGESVWLEIGAGKGGFACGMAVKNPEVHYYAMERVTDCVVLAAERARATHEATGALGNLRFIIGNADNLPELFSEGSVDRIFLNFSDPWSKKGYAKRRLTHRRYLDMYMKLLAPGGKLRFKTDNVGLFDFSLEEIEVMGLTPDIVTRDLHSSEWQADNVITEYEAAFSAQGMKINMLELTRPDGYRTPVGVLERRKSEEV